MICQSVRELSKDKQTNRQTDKRTYLQISSKFWQVTNNNKIYVPPGFSESWPDTPSCWLLFSPANDSPPHIPGLHTHPGGISSMIKLLPSFKIHPYQIVQIDWPLFMRTSWCGNNVCITGPLWGEFTVIGGFPSQRASNTELWQFLWY